MKWIEVHNNGSLGIDWRYLNNLKIEARDEQSNSIQDEVLYCRQYCVN